MTFAPDLQVSAQGVEPEGSDEGAELHNQLVQQTAPTRTFRYPAHYGQVLVTSVFMVIPRAAAAAVCVWFDMGSSPSRVKSAFAREFPHLGLRRANAR